MKRFKKVILTLLFPLFVVGCVKSRDGWKEGGDKLKILSTTAQVGDLVQAVGGSRIESRVLIRGDLDPHSYEIVKGDAEKLDGADLIFYNGLGLEHGASLASRLRAASKAVAVGERVRDRAPEQIIMRGDVVDPHIWMDISLWQKGVDPVVEALSKADPEGASYYREQGRSIEQKMAIAHEEVRAILQKVPSEKRYLVTSHDAFQYFTRSYLAEKNEERWEDRFAAPEGLAPEGQLNPRDIQKIIDYLRLKKISVLFPESNVSRDSIRKIASAGRELGLDLQVCSEPLYGDAMSGLSYLEMMKRNAETIARYLWNTP